MNYFQIKSRIQALELLILIVVLTAFSSSFTLNLIIGDNFTDFLISNKSSNQLRLFSILGNVFYFILYTFLFSIISLIKEKIINFETVLSYVYITLAGLLPFFFPITNADFINQNIFYTLNLLTLYVFIMIFCTIRSGFVDSISLRLDSLLRNFKYANGIVLVSIGLYVIYFAVLTIMRHLDFQSGAFDLGIYTHVFHSLSVGDGSWQTVNYNGDFGADTFYAFKMTHFSPFYYLLLPFYMLYPRAESLLVIQALFMGAAAYPLYRLVVFKTESKLIGIILVISYLLNPAVERANFFDFHDVKFMPFFLFGAFYFLEKNNHWKFLLCMILVVAIKEDLAIVGFLGSIYYFIRNKKIKFSVLSGVGFLVYYFVITKFYMAYTMEGFIFKDMHTETKIGMGGVILSILSNPFYVLKYITLNMVKVAYWYKQVQYLGFLPLLSPDSLLMMITCAIISLFSYNDAFSSIGTQYALYPIPFLYYATTLSLHRYIKFKHFFLVSYLLLFIAFFHNKYSGVVMRPKNIITDFHHPDVKNQINKLLLLIPKDAIVSATHSLVPHLSERKNIYMFPRIDTAEYIVYQKLIGSAWPLTENENMTIIHDLLTKKEYGIFKFIDERLFILKRGYKCDLSLYPFLMAENYHKASNLPHVIGENKVVDNVNCRYAEPAFGQGHIMYGPYCVLEPGKYELNVEIKILDASEEVITNFDIVSAGFPDAIVKGTFKKADLPNSKEGQFSKWIIPFEIKEKREGVEFRMDYLKNGKIWIKSIQFINLSKSQTSSEDILKNVKTSVVD